MTRDEQHEGERVAFAIFQGANMFNFFKKIFPGKSEAPGENIFSGVPVDSSESDRSRALLKEATALKREKKYEEACEKLKQAYSEDVGNNLTIEERLRLPMYLQLAKKNDDGWRVLNELNVSYTDAFSQAEIANQMRIFLEKEKKYSQALLFAVWSICKEIERDKYNVFSVIKAADELGDLDQSLRIPGLNDGGKLYGNTPRGNPIRDASFKLFQDRLISSMSAASVLERIQPLLKKIKKEEQAEGLAGRVENYFKSSDTYDLIELRSILAECIFE